MLLSRLDTSENCRLDSFSTFCFPQANGDAVPKIHYAGSAILKMRQAGVKSHETLHTGIPTKRKFWEANQ